MKQNEVSGEKEHVRDWIFGAGQSKRIWSELYKVVDASDVLIQVCRKVLSVHVTSLVTALSRPMILFF